MVITGALTNKKTGEVIAVGEWEALEEFLSQMKKLNPQTFNKRDFNVEQTVTTETVRQANVCMHLSFGKTLHIKSMI